MKLELDSFVKHTTGDSHAFVVSSMEIDAYLRRTANDGNDELFNVRTTTVNTIVHHNHDTGSATFAAPVGEDFVPPPALARYLDPDIPLCKPDGACQRHAATSARRSVLDELELLMGQSDRQWQTGCPVHMSKVRKDCPPNILPFLPFPFLISSFFFSFLPHLRCRRRQHRRGGRCDLLRHHQHHHHRRRRRCRRRRCRRRSAPPSPPTLVAVGLVLLPAAVGPVLND